MWDICGLSNCERVVGHLSRYEAVESWAEESILASQSSSGSVCHHHKYEYDQQILNTRYSNTFYSTADMWSFMFSIFCCQARAAWLHFRSASEEEPLSEEEGSVIGAFEWDQWIIGRYHLWYLRERVTSWFIMCWVCANILSQSREDVWVVWPRPNPLPSLPLLTLQPSAPQSQWLYLSSPLTICVSVSLKEAAPPSQHPLPLLLWCDLNWDGHRQSWLHSNTLSWEGKRC